MRILSIYHNLNFVFREYCECSRLYVSFLHVGYERCGSLKEPIAVGSRFICILIKKNSYYGNTRSTGK